MYTFLTIIPETGTHRQCKTFYERPSDLKRVLNKNIYSRWFDRFNVKCLEQSFFTAPAAAASTGDKILGKFVKRDSTPRKRKFVLQQQEGEHS